MRVGSVLLALALLAPAAGCGGTLTSHRSITAEKAQGFEVARRFDAGVLAVRLAAGQRGWPGPRLPLAPPPRHVDCARLKCVALTFDDGPGEQTGEVLDMLAAHHARATFFLLGQMVKDGQDFVRRMVSEGHELGNHSWSHPSLTGLSSEALSRELGRTQDIVRQITGVRMRLMRPPYESTDQRVEAATRREGLAQILWAVDTLDWRDHDPAVVARRCGQAKPGDIVLMHDIHRTTVQAVPRLLDELDRRGFTYVTISELFGSLTPGRQYVNRPHPGVRPPR